MASLLDTPVDQLLGRAWTRIHPESRKAFFWLMGLSLLAFGFEMTNLTLHHDDLIQIFIQDDILGHYLGRFLVGKLHLYTQGHFFIPFLQMVEGMVLMALYAIIVARFWGVERTLDLVLVGGVICVFPYMAQVYQYNTSMATYPMAHLLAALAVIASVRRGLVWILVGALLYIAAFGIYQSVLANAATIFLVWMLLRAFSSDEAFFSRDLWRAVGGALAAVLIGGIVYVLIVKSMHIQFDAYQDAGEAFELEKGIDITAGIHKLINGTRAYFFWPEHYYPGFLKKLQLLLLLAAGLVCLLRPRKLVNRAAAVVLFGLAALAPRVLELLHPHGHYHALTLTAYALVLAAAVTLLTRHGGVLARNLATLVTALLLAGFLLQTNWISTVNHLNTLAHITRLNEVLARVRAIRDPAWDGRRIIVVGRLNLPSEYPFKPATGVATEFMDASHMQKLAGLLRARVEFIQAGEHTPEALAWAANRHIWPASDSVGVVNGTGVVVFAPVGRQPAP